MTNEPEGSGGSGLGGRVQGGVGLGGGGGALSICLLFCTFCATINLSFITLAADVVLCLCGRRCAVCVNRAVTVCTSGTFLHY